MALAYRVRKFTSDIISIIPDELERILHESERPDETNIIKAHQERKLAKILSRVMLVLGGYDGSNLGVFGKELSYLKDNGIAVKSLLLVK